MGRVPSRLGPVSACRELSGDHPVQLSAGRGAVGAVPGGVLTGPGATETPEPPITIENLTVTVPGSLNAMSRTDLRTMAEFLRNILRDLDRSQRGQVTV